MKVYRPHSEHPPLEPWPDLEEEGDVILSGTPKQSGRIDWGDVAAGPAAGRWSCTPGRFRSHYTYSELCTILDGEVTIVTSDGTSHRFGPGEGFFVPQGETVTWHIHSTVTKSFMFHVAP